MPIRPYYDLGGFTPTPSYYDLPGARMMPGGSLAVSRSQSGQARSIPGVDMPVVGYPGTGWSPGMRASEGGIPGAMQPVHNGEIGGGPASAYAPIAVSGDYPGGSYGAYPAPDMNIPTNEDVLPAMQTLLYRNQTPRIFPTSTPAPAYQDVTASGPSQYAGYPTPGAGSGGSIAGDWAGNAARTTSVGWNPSEGGILGKIAGYLPQLAPYFAGQALYKAGRSLFGGIGDLVGGIGSSIGNLLNPPGGYPVPGGGNMANAAGDWAQNATRQGGYNDFGTTANTAAANAGFGGGLASAGQGGWQTVSDIPQGAFGSIGPGNAFGGGGSRVFLS